MKKELSLANFQLPQSEDVEARILYEIITEPSYISEVRRVITPDVFSSDTLKKAFAAIVSMYDNGEVIDFETVCPKMAPSAFTKISTHALDQYNGGAVEHAESLRDIHIRRLAFFSALNILDGISEACRVDRFIDEIDKLRESVMMKYQGGGSSKLSDVVNEVGEEMEKGTTTKVPTGIRPLDFLFYKGLDGGDLVILAARPGVGKTAIALQMARHEANIGLKSYIFSLEMSKKRIAKRILLASGELKPVHLFGGTMDWGAFERAVAATNGENMTINDSARTVNEICSTITMAHQQGKCDVAFIDYLGLISLAPDRSATTAQLIGNATRELKNCATRNNIPIVLLCQLNRLSVNENRSPRLTDLRDSGSIEQDADRVIMMERPEVEGEGNFIDMWVRKNRDGKGGDVCIHLKGDDTYSNFIEYEEQTY